MLGAFVKAHADAVQEMLSGPDARQQVWVVEVNQEDMSLAPVEACATIAQEFGFEDEFTSLCELLARKSAEQQCVWAIDGSQGRSWTMLMLVRADERG